jgi:hypothetical protein
MRLSSMVFDDDYYRGLCWIEPLGTLRLLDFTEMTGDELMAISEQLKYGKK